MFHSYFDCILDLVRGLSLASQYTLGDYINFGLDIRVEELVRLDDSVVEVLIDGLWARHTLETDLSSRSHDLEVECHIAHQLMLDLLLCPLNLIFDTKVGWWRVIIVLAIFGVVNVPLHKLLFNYLLD